MAVFDPSAFGSGAFDAAQAAPPAPVRFWEPLFNYRKVRVGGRH